MTHKVSIGIFTTLYDRSFKAAQFSSSISHFEKLGILEKMYIIPSRSSFKKNVKFVFYSNLFWVMLIIISYFRLLRFYPSHIRRRILKYLFYFFYYKKIMKDESGFVIVSSQPLQLIKKLYGKKKIILSFESIHPNSARDILLTENNYQKIPHYYSPYTDEKYIKESIKAIEMADRILVLSNYSRKTFLMNGIEPEKVLTINEPISLGGFKALQYKPKSTIAFFYVAHHSLLKGTHRFIEAWNQFKLDYPALDNQLFIVGSVSNELRRLISRYSIEKISFLGTLDFNSIYDTYQEYNPVGVLLSFIEGAPRVVKEFVSLNIPCIVSEVASADIIIDSCNGFVVDPSDKDKISKLLFEIQNKNIYQKFMNYNINSLKQDIDKEYALKIKNIMESLK